MSARLLSTLLVATTLASVCLAQQPKKVDPGTTDASSAAVSLRRMDVDLRRPTGFENVYLFQGADIFGRGQSMFMRIDGGVTAMFPRSVYVPTRLGMLPEIPPGTIFYIGALPPGPRDPASHISPTFLNTSLSMRSSPAPESLPAIREVPIARSLISNEVYRRHRIEALLSVADAK